VIFGTAEVRKRLRIPVRLLTLLLSPEATSVSYLKRLAPRPTTAAGSVEPSFAQPQPQKQDDHNHDSKFVDGIHVLNRQLHCGRHRHPFKL